MMPCLPLPRRPIFLAKDRLPRAFSVHDPSRHCFHGSKVFSARRSERQAVARAPQNGGGQSSPPPDMATMFREAQNNIMRLNQSRLKALEELKTARSRITELETRLAEAAAQSDSLSIQFSATEPARRRSNHSEDVESTASRPDLQADASPSSQQLQPGRESSSDGVTIAYGTGWDIAFIHYKTPKTGWTPVPGIQMGAGTGNLSGSKVATIEGAGRLEFVINNGQNAWDTPDPYGGGEKNYVVDGPGTYYLKSGRVQKLW